MKIKTDRFGEWGIASVLPGARYIVERMLEEIKYLEQVLHAHQENREEGLRRVAREVNREFGFDSKRGEFVKPKRGRPPGVKTGRGQWRTKSGRLMNAEERREESKRRRSRWGNPKAKRPRVNGAEASA